MPKQQAAELAPDAIDSASPASERTPVHISSRRAGLTYANFCRVSTTPEEVIVEVGMNPQPLSGEPVELEINERIVLSPYTAKRLAQALTAAIARYEQAFGVLETDPRKRVRSQT